MMNRYEIEDYIAGGRGYVSAMSSKEAIRKYRHDEVLLVRCSREQAHYGVINIWGSGRHSYFRLVNAE